MVADGRAERVGSRHSLKVEPAGFDSPGSRAMGKGQSQATSQEDGASKFCEGAGLGVAHFSTLGRWEIRSDNWKGGQKTLRGWGLEAGQARIPRGDQLGPRLYPSLG